MTVSAVLQDVERFPAINDFSYLKSLRQHPQAPAFNFKSGDRLTTDDLQKIRHYKNKVNRSPSMWEQGSVPDWVHDYVARCTDAVPFYKKHSGPLEERPSICRGDLRRSPWDFVSDQCDTDDLLVYETSGTTGPPLSVLFDRIAQASYLPLLELLLERFHIRLPKGPGHVAIALICSQKQTLTYASLSGYLEGAGILKINLDPSFWKHPNHRCDFLKSVSPHILTGDPMAFLDLLRLKPDIKPKALVSSAMTLLSGLKQELEAYFNCPVIDVYSLTECRMVAESTDLGHRLIRPDLYVEVLERDNDFPVPLGEMGELTLTGGNNPFCNLIRYRTGDFCKLSFDSDGIYLQNFQGRKPVIFKASSGKRINSVDIARAFCSLGLAGYTLHQRRDYSIHLTLIGNPIPMDTLEPLLLNIFGAVSLKVVCGDTIEQRGSKLIPFSSGWEEDL